MTYPIDSSLQSYLEVAVLSNKNELADSKKTVSTLPVTVQLRDELAIDFPHNRVLNEVRLTPSRLGSSGWICYLDFDNGAVGEESVAGKAAQ